MKVSEERLQGRGNFFVNFKNRNSEQAQGEFWVRSFECGVREDWRFGMLDCGSTNSFLVSYLAILPKSEIPNPKLFDTLKNFFV